jgi:hypothetical protein
MVAAGAQRHKEGLGRRAAFGDVTVRETIRRDPGVINHDREGFDLGNDGLDIHVGAKGDEVERFLEPAMGHLGPDERALIAHHVAAIRGIPVTAFEDSFRFLRHTGQSDPGGLAVGCNPSKDKRRRFRGGADAGGIKTSAACDFGFAVHQRVRKAGKSTGLLDPTCVDNFIAIRV